MLELIEFAMIYIPRWEAITCFILLASGLVWALTTKQGWIYKISIIFLALLTVILFSISVSNSMGWPARHKLPDRFRFVWAEVVEPSKEYAGAIRWWVRYVDEHGEDINVNSRLFELKYTVGRHRRTIKIMQQLLEGKPVMMQREGSNSALADGERSLLDEPADSEFSDSEGENAEGNKGLIPLEPQQSLPPKDGTNNSDPRAKGGKKPPSKNWL